MFKRTIRSSKTKSPIKAPPLPFPGQSLEEKLRTLFEDKILFWILYSVLGTLLCIWEWVAWYLGIPRRPVEFTLAMATVVGWGVWQIVRALPVIRQYRQGISGERAVGQFLDHLRASGYRVFHDIVEDDFNIDHALIGPTGVFAIETKTISKPLVGEPVVEYDGTRVIVDGHSPDRDPVKQVSAAADCVARILEESTGRRVKVRGVVLYPGWFVQSQPKGCNVWVLNPKAFPAFLAHEELQLGAEDIALFAFHLSRYQRSQSRKL